MAVYKTGEYSRIVWGDEMSEKWKQILFPLLNIIMGSSTGVFMGYSIYEYYHFKKYPQLYAMQSAPWYTGIFVHGLFTVALLTTCTIIKVLFMEKARPIKKIALISGIIFLLLTFAGVSYVLINQGQKNAGYAVIPGLWAVICFRYYGDGKHK